jgi:hypothetical protein
METVRLLLRLGAWQRIVEGFQSLLRLGVIATGFGAFLVVVNNLFDYVLYPTVLCRMGFGWGVISLALISIPFNQLLVAGFNWIGREVILFSWLWNILGCMCAKLRNVVFATLVVTARDVFWVFTMIRHLVMTIRVPIMTIRTLIRFIATTAMQLWKWAGGHLKFITFLGLSVYDTIPAMLFAQQIYGVKFRSLSYASLFLTATVVANAAWALLVVLGLESLQALDQEILALIQWGEEWSTWTADMLGMHWQANFGLLREVLGTCAI